MPTLRQIKDRIGAVEKIKKIADAMEIVSLTRLRRIEQHTVKARDYFNEIRSLLFSLGKSLIFEAHPILKAHREVKTIGLVALSSDRGLCGNFNSNIAKKSMEFFSTHKGKKIVVISIGKKGTGFLKNRKEAEVIKNLPSSFRENSLENASEVSKTLLDMYIREEIDELYLIYNQFKLQFLGSSMCEKLFPFKPFGDSPDSTTSSVNLGQSSSGTVPSTKDYIFEPSPFLVLDNLVKEYIANQIEQAILESNTAEEMARMLAMKQARDNAGDLTNTLELVYHKTRQGQITRELMDIISGAEIL